jgi:hypothetical protein
LPARADLRHPTARQGAVGARGDKSDEKPQIGRDGKWQFNMYDPNFTRVELMEPKPVEKPTDEEAEET